jgi:hypothetical protein
MSKNVDLFPTKDVQPSNISEYPSLEFSHTKVLVVLFFLEQDFLSFWLFERLSTLLIKFTWKHYDAQKEQTLNLLWWIFGF